MVFELLPLSVLAAETVPGDDELLLTETVLTEPGTETAVAEEDPKSGSCGPTATWKMEGDVLYIEGEGPMYDFVVPSYLPEPDKTVLKAPWKDEQFHYASCRNCWEDILEPHNWEYTPQPVNSGHRAPLARTFSSTLAGKQLHRHGRESQGQMGGCPPAP